jgi:hypothetical protein
MDQLMTNVFHFTGSMAALAMVWACWDEWRKERAKKAVKR